MNRDVEQQVWQRVLGQSEPPRGSLRPMELEAMEAAAVYRKLAGQFSGRGREQLRHLHDTQMEMLACLRGIGCPAVGVEKQRRSPFRRSRQRRRWKSGITAPGVQ